MTGCESPKVEKAAEQKSETTHESAPDVVKLTEDQIRSAKIEKVKVALKPFRTEIEALGEVASDTDRVSQIRPDTDGTVKEIKVAVGDAVDAGQVLVRYTAENGTNVKELKTGKPGGVVGL